ncbi:hypothetical protein BLA27_27235 [Brucella cytisi]|uniref:Uncharacterized protein n=1 Tax=Brucella cytisi TaxID=407152 RepID=A0A1J6HQ92_9HYPH|nr:hypothetical protein BLA27_27235 [Brucella cytisi]
MRGCNPSVDSASSRFPVNGGLTLPSVSGFFISDFLWADQAVNQTTPLSGPLFRPKSGLLPCSIGYHRFLFFSLFELS